MFGMGVHTKDVKDMGVQLVPTGCEPWRQCPQGVQCTNQSPCSQTKRQRACVCAHARACVRICACVCVVMHAGEPQTQDALGLTPALGWAPALYC